MSAAPSRAPIWRGALLPLVVGLAVALAIGTAVPEESYAEMVLFGIGINIILAVSLNMVNGLTGQFSIGHAGFMALGAYASIAVTYYGGFALFGDVARHDDAAGLTLFVGSLLVGGVVAALAGWVVGLPSLRLRGDYLAIVTLGFGEIIRVLLQSTPAVLSPHEMSSVSPAARIWHLGGALGFSHGQSYNSLYSTYLGVAVTIVCAYRLRESTLGRTFLAVRENELAAAAVGVDTTRIKVTAFVMAAFFAGVAGGLFGHQLGAGTASRPEEFNFMRSFDVVIMVVLGGMGSVSGAALAAIALTLLTEALRSAEDFRLISYALLLILVMILRPEGLFGTRELWSRWQHRRQRRTSEVAP